jgi:hypothetical protein
MPTVLSITPARRGSAPILVTTTELDRSYFPSLGLPCSLLVHGIVITAILFFPLFETLPAPPAPQFAPRDHPSDRLVTVMYLPAISPGGPQTAPKGDAPPIAAPAATIRPAPRTKGLVYPGPQEIVSDFPQPTNRFQTLLQPDLENPPVVEPPLALPNFVEMAAPAFTPPPRPLSLALTPDSVEFRKEQPPTPPAIPETVQAELEPQPPQPISDLALPVPLDLPASRAQVPQFTVGPPPSPAVPARLEAGSAALTPEPATPVPDTEPAAPTRPEPPPVELSPLPVHGTGRRNALALSPMPTLGERPAQLPAGEARGRFVISPEPNLAASETEPGAAVGDPPSETVPGVITLAPPRANASQNQVTISFGPSVKTESSATSGGGTPGTGADSRGGAGGAAGSAGPAGSGGASGAGNAPFAGITIVGGNGWTGPASGSVTQAPALRPLQTSYGLFVVSTERGGGGLPFFGVFGDQQVYTVFLDMRETETDPTPSWTVEFALAEDTATYVDVADKPANQGLVLPFPAVKERPKLPAELVRKHNGKMVIVYALINAEGKLEQLSVKETPDPALSEPVIDALSQWVFRPAVLEGRSVVMKMLLGIRLWLP